MSQSEMKYEMQTFSAVQFIDLETFGCDEISLYIH